MRLPKNILTEIKAYVDICNIPKNAKIRLKCYGDNIGPQKKLVKSLANEIEKCLWWKEYDFSWTFYCQSSFLTEELAVSLKRTGTSDLFIGFDGINDHIQKLNGLGTNLKTHERAVKICDKHEIKLQASSVVGLIGETPKTLHEQYQFFKELADKGILERINSGVIAIVPGSLSYQMLIEKEPWLKERDFFPVLEMQKLWIKHFCPKVNPLILKDYAVKIDRLSPGPHGSIGYNKQEDIDE
ncbi:MAG: hypothetical protein GWO79_00560 [Actinobacteria bacterium]|nr:hypothetical protein [Actinomycetota bacterium]